MNHSCCSKSWLTSILVAMILVSPALAEGPKPKDAEADKAKATKPTADDPAVAALLETKPTTPAECVRAAKILADLGRADLAKGFLKKAIDAKLNAKQLAELGEEVGTATFFDLADRPGMQPEGKKLADAVAAAMKAKLEDSKRIADLIRQLQDPNTFLAAVKGLQEAQAAAVGPLIAVLADPARTGEYANVRAALVEMGRLAQGPLLAIVEDADPKLAVQAIETLGATGDRRVALGLLAPAISASSDPAVRRAAAAQLARLVGGAPSSNEAVRMLTDKARAYFDGQQPAEGVVRGRAEWWRWDAAKRRCVFKSLTSAAFGRAMAARLAKDAFAISPENRDVGVLYAMTILERAAYENGLDWPLADDNAAVVAAKRLGLATLDDALRQAMATGHPAAAAAAARILGEIGQAESLLAQGTTPSPLVQAVQSPNRRLRMAALEAIVRLQPLRPFAGSSAVPSALGFLAGGGGARRALIACPNVDEAGELAGMLTAAGYQVDSCASGRDLLFRAAKSPDYEVALIDMAVNHPTIDILLQQLRHDARTASLRVGLIARDGFFDRAKRSAELDPLSVALSRPHDERSFHWQLDQLTKLAPAEFVDLTARQRQAARALDLLAELQRGSDKVYDLRPVRNSVIAALYSPKLGAKAAAVLARINSAESQKALVDAASRPTLPLALRQAAARAFRQNAESFGILLTTDEIREQYRRYNESKTQDADTQHLLGFILDCLEVSKPAKPK